MKSVTGKELGKILERNGWVLLRMQGSHHIYGREGSKIRISVPMHAGKTLKKGVVRHVLGLAGLCEGDL